MSASELRSDLTSGDPARQVGALLQVLGMLASGKDVGLYTSLVCHSLLAAPNTGPEPKKLAYDLASTAPLSDADWVRAGLGIRMDLQKDVGRDVRARALRVLPLLPPHRLATMMLEAGVMERVVISLRSTSDAVRAAACTCFAELAVGGAVLAPAASSPALLGALIDAWEAITNLLTDDSDVVCCAACAALEVLLRTARLSGGDSLVLQNLVQAVHSRSASVLAVAMARFRMLNTVLLTHVPPLLLELLRSQRPSLDRRELTVLPGDLPPTPPHSTAGAAGAHFYDTVSCFLLDLLGLPSQPVMLAAADALLQLAQEEGVSAPVQAALPRAIQALMDAVGPHTPTAPVTLPQVLPLLLGHLRVLPPSYQVSLFHRMLPLVAALPSAAERTKAICQLWMAVLQYDWGGKAVRRNPGSAASTPTELQQLLSDPHVKEIVSGIPTRDEGLGRTASGLDPRLVYPAFREELTGALLHLLLTHNRALSQLAGSSVAGASSAVSQAVELQALLQTMEWLSSAKVALQGTKACLGWDRGGSSRVEGITTGTTAVVDLWLQLLLGAIQVCEAVQGVVLERQEARQPPPAASTPHGLGDEGVVGEPHAAHTKPEERPLDTLLEGLRRRLGTIEMDMQGMLLQIITNWRALHPVVRPRAVWVCAVHLRYKSTLDSAWNGILDAVRGMLGDSRKTEVSNYLPAVGEGVLARREGSGGGPSALAAGAATASQNAEVALLCLERLVLLVAHNNRRSLADQLQPIGALLKKVIEVEVEREGAPGAKERLVRLQQVVGPVATGGKKKEGGGGKENEAQNQENGVVVVDLTPDPAQPAAAAYPLTLPSASALFSTMEATRYRKFLAQLQAAQGALDTHPAGATPATTGTQEGEGGQGPGSQPSVGGVPGWLELAAVLRAGEGVRSVGSQQEEVTGPASPLALLLSHSVDPGSGTATVYCRVVNNTLEELRGVEVEFVAGGPLAPEVRRPLSYRLDPLPPAEASSWDIPLGIEGFGGPLLQPTIILPVKLPEGQARLRCKPYAISPLHLLLPPTSPVTLAEFYQRWQALPHRVQVTAVATEGGVGGLHRVLAKLEKNPMVCVAKSLSPVQGSLHAALHGCGWGGEVIGCVVTGALAPGGAQEGRLTFYFRSDSAEVMTHVQGHQGELLGQLTGGLAAPAQGDGDGMATEADAARGEATEGEEPTVSRPAFMSFLRGVTTRAEVEPPAGGYTDSVDDEGGEEEARAAAEQLQLAVEREVLAQWQRLRAMRVG